MFTKSPATHERSTFKNKVSLSTYLIQKCPSTKNYNMARVPKK